MRGPGPQTLNTARLTLRPFNEGDRENIFTLYGDPEVMTIRKIGPQTRDQCDVQLQMILEHWSRLGFGLWAVMNRETGAFMGECGLRELHPKSEEIELSYGLTPEFWGKGFASEMAPAALSHGFSCLGLGVIYGLAKRHNHASLHILRKLGFRHQSELGDGENTVVRSILTKGAWVKARHARP
jgi:ribosomal-protein-alanine N-acetyltransferase